VVVSQVSARLGFTVQPSSTLKGNTLPEPVRVAFWDARDNPVANESGSVSLAIGINPNHGMLGGTTTQDPVGGVATFPGLSIDSLGIGYTLKATSGSLEGESQPFHISLPAVWVALSDDDTLVASDSVTAIDLATNTSVSTAAVTGKEPYRMEISRDGGYAYLVYMYGGVTIIETPTYTPIATIPITDPTAVAPFGGVAYVATCGSGIQVVSAATRSIVATIPSGACFNSADLSPDGAFLYAGAYGQTIRVYSTATNTEVDNIGVAGFGLWDLKISPDGEFAYTIIQQDTIRKVNLSSKTVIGEVVLGGKHPWEIEVTPDGNTLYAANGDENSVSVVSTSSMSVITTIPTGDLPWELDITPDGAYVYVSNTTDGNVLVIDTSSNTVVQTLPVSGFPTAVAVNPLE
jgi:YVTN family beta-propeller protein